MSWKLLSAVLLWVGTAGAAAAQSAPRDLAVPADKSWQHAHTGMILPPRVAGLTRSALRDSGTDELDVAAAYDAPGGVTATVYIYKSIIADASLWFDRADAAIRLRNPNAVAAGGPVPFAFPGAAANSGLRMAYQVGSPGPRSTAVAITSVGGWLVKVRISASSLERAEVDEKLSAILGGLRWPKEENPARAAAPIQSCAAPLVTKKAKLVKEDMGQTLVNLISGAVVAEGGADKPMPVYCREPGPAGAHAVYRPNGSADSYIVALGDAGIALNVGPALDIMEIGSGRKSYSVVLYGRNGTSALPSFNRLPPPEQAIATLHNGSGGGMSITTTPKKQD
jgi:hypothetical protein